MADRPSTLPEWATSTVTDPTSGVDNVVEPPATSKTNGFARLSFPPRQWVNWLYKTIYLWIEHFSSTIYAKTSDTGATAISNACTAGVCFSTDSKARAAKSQINVSDDCQVTETGGQINACEDNCLIDGHLAQMNACAANCEITGDEAQMNACHQGSITGNGSQMNASATDCHVDGDNSQMNACYMSWVGGDNAQANASRSVAANADKSIIGASASCETVDGGSGFEHLAIFAATGSILHGRESAIIGSSNVQIYNVNHVAIIGSVGARNGANNGGIMPGSANVVNPQANAFVGGYAAAGATVNPAWSVGSDTSGHTMTAGGTYSGRPQGATLPVYQVEIIGGGAGDKFRWRKKEDKDGTMFQAWSDDVTITGTAQALDNGVTVTFSHTTGYIDGVWNITLNDTALTANRTIELDVAAGDVNVSGSLTGSTSFTDYAEYFENLERGVIPLGTIVARDGRKVRPGEIGDRILGVVSGTAIVAAGDSPFCWQGRYLIGEFGEPLFDVNGDRIENPDYDPSVENTPRSARPEEWSCIGLLGQLHVRVGEDVQPDGFVAADGSHSETPTRLECMNIKQPFDAEKGYAVAICLLR